MKESTGTNLCERAEDLVTYLYGEATAEETLQFERHIERCSSCRTELVAFGDVRSSVVEWRQQALRSFASQESKAAAVRGFEPVEASRRGRSALAALRQFFRLSPMWLRAATALGGVAFCALAALAVVYFVQGPRTVIVEAPVKSGYSEDQVKAMIEDVQKRQAALRASETPVPSRESFEPGTNREPKVQSSIKGNVRGAQGHAGVARRQALPRNLVRQPVTEALASSDYLPFTAPNNEERLPNLTDLLDDDDN